MNRLADPAVEALAPADWQAVAALEARIGASPWDPDTVRRVMAHPACGGFGVRGPDSGEIVGYALRAFRGTVCHVLRLAVDEPWRRRGLARRLLGAVLAEAGERGVLTAMLEVREDNLPAISLYRKLGFVPVGRRLGYYRDTGDTALVLVRHRSLPGWG
ncbi:MAG: ribosomal protein S18-alanine N-acetyltransferase [Deferrisomatales bacterium]